MAGHSKFKNIQHRKGAQDKKKSMIFSNLVKAIKVAAKIGPDPENNHLLRAAINNARKANLPKDKIESAINISNDLTDYEEIRYEAYAPHGIALVIEAITDNRNRTAAEIRSILYKKNSNLVSTGSVTYLFDYLGMLVYRDLEADKVFEAAFEAGAIDYESSDDEHLVFCAIDQLYKIQNKLAKILDREADFCRLFWRPKEKIRLEEEKKQLVLELISALEENADVQYVDSNMLIN